MSKPSLTKTRVYPGFQYKLKAAFSYNSIALTDSLFAVPSKPQSLMKDGEAYEISGNGLSKKATLHFIDKVSGETLLRQYPCDTSRMNESAMYDIWSATDAT